jgi:NADPH:quinone reductase-like Zn-dependent oxidoreductase/acyl carrier protein
MAGLVADAADEVGLKGLIADHCRDVQGVVHLWSLDLPAPETDDQPPSSSQSASLGSLLGVVQALGASSYTSQTAPRLWIATSGAQCVGTPVPLQLAQAPIWGFGKVIALEHPELRASRVDLDPAADPARQADTLFARLSAADGEDEIAVRDNVYFVARLSHANANERLVRGGSTLDAAGREISVRLEKAATGVFDDMSLKPAARRPPGPGEIEIRIIAGGLNFRDVMNAVAMRDDPEPLGGECAGRIVAIGNGVENFAVGDDVVATAEACFATFTTVDARYVALIPPGVGFAEAATIPFAFMTAHQALNVLGKLTAGETVLIHAGAGGVGTAAIQLAQRAGATLIATAGSEEKRAFLKSLGVAHVMSSRTLEFADRVAELTQGRGVDVVLNSLAGDFIGASVRCLTPEGRFLEIGKRDIWTEKQFKEQRPRGRYYPIDLAAQRYADQQASFDLLADVMARATRGEIRPLPLHVFPLERAAEAFRFMAQAKHIGKIVLIQHDAARASLDHLQARGSYLVTGGLTGLGLLTATRMVERGARHMVLVGRRAPSEPALAAISKMRAQGVQVTIVQADMARREEIARVLAVVASTEAPLRGVVHSAGMLADGAMIQQQWQRFAGPLGPKVDGSWALHELTRNLRLDFFVTYSSMAAMLGSPGQSNHAAANAFMDALAVHRRALGLPGLSIGWGAWSEIGAAADRKVDQRVAAQGIDSISPSRGIELLEALMRAPAPHVGVFPVRWNKFLAQSGRAFPPFFERMRAAAHSAARSAISTPVTPPPQSSLSADLQDATPLRRQELLLAFVADHVARVIGAQSAQSIDPRQPLNELGLDSLMAVELRNRLGTGLGLARNLPATLVFDYPTLEALAQYLEREVSPPDEADPAASAPPARTDRVEAIDELSDEEIERLYAKKLGRS